MSDDAPRSRPVEPAPEPSRADPARPGVAGFHLRRRDAVILGLTAIVAVGGVSALAVISSRQDVWFANGLDVPVRIEVGSDTFVVGAQAKERRNVGVGLRRVVAKVGDAIIDDGWIDVPRFTDVVVYNVLGAAPVFQATIVYTNSPRTSSDDASVTFLGDSRFVTHDRIDFPFREPPQQIKVKGGQRHTRTHVEVAPGGWGATVGHLMREGRLGRAARLARAVAAAEPAHPAAQSLESLVLIGEGAEASARALRAHRDAQPDDLDVHYGYQHAMLRAGLGAALAEEYRERSSKAPSSALEAAMHARAERPAEAAKAYEALATRFPDDPLASAAIAYRALCTGEPERASMLFDRISTGPTHARWADDHAQALVASGRVADAAALLDRLIAGNPADELRVLLSRAQLSALPGAPSSPRREPTSDASKAWMRSVLGEPVTGPEADNPLSTTVAIHAAAIKDPHAARQLCEAAPAFSLVQLHSAIGMLLTAELERIGDHALASRVFALGVRAPIGREAVVAYLLDGTEDAELAGVDPESRAALDFVRARVLAETDAKAAAKLLEMAKKRDALRGPVSKAMAAWPAPGAASSDGAVTFAYAGPR